jgi:hypothetical protein
MTMQAKLFGTLLEEPTHQLAATRAYEIAYGTPLPKNDPERGRALKRLQQVPAEIRRRLAGAGANPNVVRGFSLTEEDPSIRLIARTVKCRPHPLDF